MKVTIKECLDAVQSLLDLELQTISDNLDFHWEFNGWLDDYGESSKKFFDDFTDDYKPSNHIKLLIAEQMQKDFESGWWVVDEHNNCLYDIYMGEEYGGWLTEFFTIQLADLTKTIKDGNN